jgi:hypothetical protein
MSFTVLGSLFSVRVQVPADGSSAAAERGTMNVERGNEPEHEQRSENGEEGTIWLV